MGKFVGRRAECSLVVVTTWECTNTYLIDIFLNRCWTRDQTCVEKGGMLPELAAQRYGGGPCIWVLEPWY